MKDMWSAAISPAHCNAQFRQELGAWVWANTDTGGHEFGETILGAQVPYGEGTHGSVAPGPMPQDTPGRYVVAFFHTHTPTYYSQFGREVGVSGADH